MVTTGVMESHKAPAEVLLAGRGPRTSRRASGTLGYGRQLPKV